MPTLESLAATALLRQHVPDIKVRFVNVVDLFKLVPHTEHAHGMTDREFEALFTSSKPVIFNFHSYPWLIHRLTYRRPGQHHIHVRGYKEKGNISTPLELAILNQTDRFSLAIDAIDRIPASVIRGPVCEKHCLINSSPVRTMPTSLEWIDRIFRIGSGRFNGGRDSAHPPSHCGSCWKHIIHD